MGRGSTVEPPRPQSIQPNKSAAAPSRPALICSLFGMCVAAPSKFVIMHNNESDF
jgi:hypothetical protein